MLIVVGVVCSVLTVIGMVMMIRTVRKGEGPGRVMPHYRIPKGR